MAGQIFEELYETLPAFLRLLLVVDDCLFFDQLSVQELIRHCNHEVVMVRGRIVRVFSPQTTLYGQIFFCQICSRTFPHFTETSR